MEAHRGIDNLISAGPCGHSRRLENTAGPEKGSCSMMKPSKAGTVWQDSCPVRRNVLITCGVLFLTAVICAILHQFVSTDTHVPLIFVLAIVIISRFTDGYRYGIAASFLALFSVNCLFTYPYFRLNFSITGYPLTFAVMLTVTVIISALTTQIKQQEQIKLQMEREQMRANLLRSVSHDIRTPLTSIVGSASAILDNYDCLDDEQKKTLTGDIRTEAQWLNRIVENILSITRISGGSTNIAKSDELAEEVVSSAVQKFHKHSPSIPVQVDVPGEVLLVPMDPVLIEQVLLNLMDNSVMHGRDISHIVIHVTHTPGYAVFSVEDDGVGIDPQILPHMFDGTLPLHSRDTDSSHHNMQIGLSVCMSIVRAHRGTMQAENRPEGGARVWFSLPLENANS